jgi:hypothetical protein
MSAGCNGWCRPTRATSFAVTIGRMATTMRRLLAGRLLGMLFEGVLIWFFLMWIAGVPMALLLGIITGMLAFIPNIGAFVSGVLMVTVGFSAGHRYRLWAIIIYFGVQTFDGYVVIPMVARRTVDHAAGAHPFVADPREHLVRRAGAGARRSDRRDDQGRAGKRGRARRQGPREPRRFHWRVRHSDGPSPNGARGRRAMR